eukprot:m.85047 g.85047  ORF g.85047 m.85047 type:complete len:209 (+) comp25826_c1_seq1:436-1062(+)
MAFNQGQRRFWMGVTSFFHFVYAVLFIVRSVFYSDMGGNDRPFYYESYLTAYTIPPGFATLMGWEKPYSQPALLKFVVALNGNNSLETYGPFIASVISNPENMFYYQIAEGIFHIMICVGSIWLFVDDRASRKSSLLTLYRVGLWLEIIVMDLAYGIAFNCLLPLSIPDYYGLMVWVVFLHHISLLPDVMSAWYEWRADRQLPTTKKE